MKNIYNNRQMLLNINDTYLSGKWDDYELMRMGRTYKEWSKFFCPLRLNQFINWRNNFKGLNRMNMYKNHIYNNVPSWLIVR